MHAGPPGVRGLLPAAGALPDVPGRHVAGEEPRHGADLQAAQVPLQVRNLSNQYIPGIKSKIQGALCFDISVGLT